jgi:hypothetical protein
MYVAMGNECTRVARAVAAYASRLRQCLRARAEDREANELITNEQKTALGALHLRKIDLADRVLVVKPCDQTRLPETTTPVSAVAAC